MKTIEQKTKSAIREARTRAPGRPREFDMDEALDKAVEVFCERGYNAASITDLARAMELTAGSIYKAFKDKRAVYVAAFDRQRSVRWKQLQSTLESEQSGREKLRAMLMFYASISHGVEGRLGCLVVSTATELATFDSEIAAQVEDSLRGRETLIADLIRLGQADGSISAATNVKAAARFMLCLLQGMRVVGKTSPAQADMEAAVDVAMKALD